MIKRQLLSQIQQAAKAFPVLTITGPRQSGKTTLCRAAFPNHAYVSLEDPQERDFATRDPRAFLARYSNGAILDEIQRAPDLASYIQGIVDAKKEPAQFILTGSENFALSETVSQSLAGRTAIFTLLPFSMSELSTIIQTQSVEEILYRGFYPRIFDQNISPTPFYGSYVQTYIERDLRNLSNVHDLGLFQTFLKLCAGRTGQLLNLENLGNEAGVNRTTAKQWISLLETSYIVYQLRPYYKNFNKRITKTPKLYFGDVGLACYLLGIQSQEHLQAHPLKGALFETLVVTELLKSRLNQGLTSNMYFFRDSNDNEVDVIMETPPGLTAIEIKSGQTITSDFWKGLGYFSEISSQITPVQNFLVYGGTEKQSRSAGTAIGFREFCDVKIGD